MSRYVSIKIVLLVLCVWAGSDSVHAQSSHLALVTDLKGDVVIVRAGGSAAIDARWGTQLFEGDEVKTRSGGGASILFANNNLVTLGSNSSITIQAGPSPAAPSAQARTIDGPLLADVSGLTMHRTGQGDIAALGTLRSVARVEGVEPTAPRGTKVQSPHPVFEWRASASMETFAVRVFDAAGLVWKGETDERRIAYPMTAPTLIPDKEYLWQVEGEELLEAVKSPLVAFTVLSPEARKDVEAHENSFEAQFGDDPNGSNHHFILGSFYAQHGLLSAAISSFERIAERHPDSALPYEILGKLYTDVGLKDNAISAFQRAIALGQ